MIQKSDEEIQQETGIKKDELLAAHPGGIGPEWTMARISRGDRNSRKAEIISLTKQALHFEK